MNVKLSVGQVVTGRFEVERVLGSGGTAIVYLVRENATGVSYALKVLTITSQTIRERMLREGEVQQKLAHHNIVRVMEVLDLSGTPGLLMEYINGPSLEGALGRYGLTLGDAETLFLGILSGVRAAHEMGLVHRDIKPANVLLSRTPEGFIPKVTDFGLAKLMNQNDTGVAHTRSGIAMGTPSYMAPEQIRDARAVDQRADIWSLGCVLYELCTKKRAFPGDEALAIYNAVVDGEFEPPRKLVAELPEALDQAIQGCLRVNPAERIPDCRTLQAVLQGVESWPLPENTITENDGKPARQEPAGPALHPGFGLPDGSWRDAADMPTDETPLMAETTVPTQRRPPSASRSARGPDPIASHADAEAAVVLAVSKLTSMDPGRSTAREAPPTRNGTSSGAGSPSSIQRPSEAPARGQGTSTTNGAPAPPATSAARGGSSGASSVGRTVASRKPPSAVETVEPAPRVPSPQKPRSSGGGSAGLMAAPEEGGELATVIVSRFQDAAFAPSDSLSGRPQLSSGGTRIPVGSFGHPSPPGGAPLPHHPAERTRLVVGGSLVAIVLVLGGILLVGLTIAGVWWATGGGRQGPPPTLPVPELPSPELTAPPPEPAPEANPEPSAVAPVRPSPAPVPGASPRPSPAPVETPRPAPAPASSPRPIGGASVPIRVETVPTGMLVQVNGRQSGLAPFVANAAPGRVTVAVLDAESQPVDLFLVDATTGADNTWCYVVERRQKFPGPCRR